MKKDGLFRSILNAVVQEEKKRYVRKPLDLFMDQKKRYWYRIMDLIDDPDAEAAETEAGAPNP